MFNMKVTTIEEEQEVSTIKVDDIIGPLLTFEMTINDKSKKRNINMAFKDDVEDDEKHVEEDIDDNLTDSIVLIAKRLGKFMRKLEKRSSNNSTTTIFSPLRVYP